MFSSRIYFEELVTFGDRLIQYPREFYFVLLAVMPSANYVTLLCQTKVWTKIIILKITNLEHYFQCKKYGSVNRGGAPIDPAGMGRRFFQPGGPFSGVETGYVFNSELSGSSGADL